MLNLINEHLYNLTPLTVKSIDTYDLLNYILNHWMYVVKMMMYEIVNRWQVKNRNVIIFNLHEMIV